MITAVMCVTSIVGLGTLYLYDYVANRNARAPSPPRNGPRIVVLGGGGRRAPLSCHS